MINLKNWCGKSVNTVPEKHIVFLSYYFPPMGGGGVQRILKLLKYWDYEKYQVTLITVKSSYFYAEDPGLSAEIPAGLHIIRTGSLDPFRVIFLLKKLLFRGSKKSGGQKESGHLLRKITGFLFLPDSRLLWLPFVLARLRRLRRKQPVDLLVATAPPFTAALAGAFARHLMGIPFLLDLRDAWTENPYLPQTTKIHRRIQQKLEAGTLRQATAAVFVNPNLGRYYTEKYPFLSNRKTRTVRNGFDPGDFENLPPVDFEKTDNTLYIGIMGTVYSQGNAPWPLLEALSELKAQGKDRLAERVKLVFIGKWAPNFVEKVRGYPVAGCIEWIGYRPHREALSLACKMDVLTLAIQSGLPGSENVTPGRIYEYLYLRKPILALCPTTSDIVDLIRKYKAGEAVPYADVTEIKSLLQKWVTMPSALQQYYPSGTGSELNRRQLAADFRAFCDRLLSGE